MEVTIHERHRVFTAQLTAFAEKLGGVSLVTEPGHSAGESQNFRPGDWAVITWTPEVGRSWVARVYGDPAKYPDQPDIDGALGEVEYTFRYNEERHAKSLN